MVDHVLAAAGCLWFFREDGEASAFVPVPVASARVLSAAQSISL
jgi:hypothetical protein